jgi:PhnB protein
MRKIDRLGLIFSKEIFSRDVEKRRNGSDYSMKTQTRVWQALHKGETTVGKVTDVSRRRFVASELSAAALGALPARSMAESKTQKIGGNEMTTLTPYLLFDGQCQQAMEFYKSCFGGELTATKVKDFPAKDFMPAVQREKIVNARLSKGKLEMTASDWLRPDRTPIRGNTVCLYLSGGTLEELNTLFERLSEAAEVTDPLKEQFFGTYRALNDKFGVRWMFQTDRKY